MADEAHLTVEGWIKNYSDILFDYLYKRLNDQSAAKDILQETFIAAWKNKTSFEKRADEKTWLFAILKNKLADHYRKLFKSIPAESESTAFFDKKGHWTKDAGPAHWPDAAASLNRKEFYEVLKKCMSGLTLAQNQVSKDGKFRVWFTGIVVK